MIHRYVGYPTEGRGGSRYASVVTIYFFDILNHAAVIQDDEGLDLPDAAAARNTAINSAREQMANAKKQGLDVTYRKIRVRNGDDGKVFTISFRDAMKPF